MTALIVPSLSAPAAARSWPTTAGWEVFEGDDFCGLALDYEGKGETRLTVAKMTDGSAAMAVTNYGWSAKKGEIYDLEFHVGTQAFRGGKSVGTGESYERRGFVTKFGADFFPAFASASSLKVYKGDTLVDSLRLQGSGAALRVVDQCVGNLRAVKASQERERQRFASIPDDPFATGRHTAGDASKASPARGNPADWISTDDYPADALAAEAEGNVRVKYTINASGRIESCTIVASSGNASLDRATCSALTRRGRYTPARGVDGSSMPATTEFSFDWKMPK
ncbi:energy transducer TonB [Sphingomonas glacialis]|nr:energy transducer TonB [Sphingomonas glacialis]